MAQKGRHRRFAETLRPAGADTGIIAAVSNTDFLQAISLFTPGTGVVRQKMQESKERNYRQFQVTGRPY
jgi:hypothetical protein